MNNKTYDLIKQLVRVGFPALATLYSGLSALWGLPYATEIVGSLALVATFLGVLLNISDKKYDPSVGNVVWSRDEDSGKMSYIFNFSEDAGRLIDHDQVTFNVVKSEPKAE